MSADLNDEGDVMDDVVIADPNDELILPIRAYATAFAAKEVALMALLAIIVIRFPSIYSFNGSSREVIGLFEAGLPKDLKAHVDLFRKYKNRKMTTIPPEEKQAVQLAREAYKEIRVNHQNGSRSGIKCLWK